MRSDSVRQMLASIVLGFEAVMFFFAALVVFGLKALPPAPALIGGAAVCVALLLNAVLVRYRWGYWLGWVMQGVIAATTVLVPLMGVVAVIFIGIWVYVMVVGARIDRQKAARVDVEHPPESVEEG
ncbi:hypothetical protein GCM10010988_01510 [Cnuibacter physcomitrellae]|nr:DUF4233 domain-containing protein [Cnuibacter physcomitrellae]MCS5498730.1 DUF4233 domain-containing protein [Cnuibacter physcomitrellae]GGI34955.1 hypothetical protein GCM10010988_01510 [Cnuibacter physcomitrellae]